MSFDQILWPTDFSENAAKALPTVSLMAEKFGATIHILYVMRDYPAFGASYGEHNPEDYEKMKKWEKEMAEKRLDELCQNFLNSCPLFIKHIAVGDPAKEILKSIQKENIGLVVMTSRGSENHFDFGSVADKVVKCTTVPILTIPV
jgi:nucleotide-binding universal stress UspA family protein